MDIMYILVWLVLGIVMGTLARVIVPGEQKIGWLPTILVGAAGSFLGAYVGKLLGVEVSTFNVWSLGCALIGAIIVLIIWCLIFKGRVRG